MSRPTTVLLDLDGTLLDSNDAHASAFRAALAESGTDVPVERIRRLIGMGGDELLTELGVDPRSAQGENVLARKKEIFLHRLLPSLAPFHGTRALIERLAEKGFTCVVVTSAGTDEVKALLERAGVEDLLTVYTTADDVDASKPAPDPVHAGLRKAGARPDDAVLLGDTPYDLEAAREAGVGMIAVRCGGWTFDDGGPIAIYDDPLDLLAHWDESPLAGDPIPA
jgi:HAD superfamily hydrolase (TIGR01509 family)